LTAEYQQGNPVFVQKIDALSNLYSTLRRIRGDGNCFFRSFIFGYLEWLLMNWDREECSRCGRCSHMIGATPAMAATHKKRRGGSSMDSNPVTGFNYMYFAFYELP
jgi:hypothetical protein